MGQNGLFNLVSLVFESVGWGFIADMNMDIAAFNNLLFRISARERCYQRSPKVEEIFFKISIPWSVGVLMNFCQRISPKAAFGCLNRMPRSMLMRSAKFYSIFCLFCLTYPSMGLGQRHTHLGALTNTRVCRSTHINPFFPGRCGSHSS